MKSSLLTVTVVLLMFAFGTMQAQEYQDQWGPEIGSEVPTIAVKDTNGETQTIDDLRGESKGLLFFFMRTSNW